MLNTRTDWTLFLGAVADTCTENHDEYEMYRHIIELLDSQSNAGLSDYQFVVFKADCEESPELNRLADRTYRKSRSLALNDGTGRLPQTLLGIAEDVMTNTPKHQTYFEITYTDK